jgi:phosphoribosylformylglycinamidine synthase
VRGLIGEGAVTAVHDASDGGLLVAIAEMAMASGIGAELQHPLIAAHAFWFGEDQARYVVTADPATAIRIVDRAKAAGVPAREIGVTGGDSLIVSGERPIPIARLREASEGWLPGYMSAGA